MDNAILRILLTIVCGLWTIFLPAQDSISSKKPKRLKVLPVPTFGYAPETRFYAGAVTLFTYNMLRDTNTYTLNAKVEFQYTVRKQVIMETEWNYFSKGEKWFSKGRFNVSKFPDYYFGIGITTSDSNRVLFNSNRIDLDAKLLRNIDPKLFAGLSLNYARYAKVENVTGSPTYSELNNGNLLGMGISLLKDSRDNLLTPTKGMYLFSNVSYQLSTTNYLKAILDFRYYKNWKSKYTLSTRFVNILNTGNPPFFDMPFLGGQYVRGYYYGRYRDNNLSALQTELRANIWRWFGMSVFGGVASNYAAKPEVLKYNVGLGVRIRMPKSEGTNLRFDYAIGQGGNNGFYVVFGESF